MLLPNLALKINQKSALGRLRPSERPDGDTSLFEPVQYIPTGCTINVLYVSSPPNLLECRRTLPMTSRQIALTSAERLGPRATERASQSMLEDPLVLNRYQRIHHRLDICKMQMRAHHEKWGDRLPQLNEFVSTLS